MRTYLHGNDGVGWSIDSDRKHTEAFLRDIGIEITSNIIRADVLHSVWWNQLLDGRNLLLRLKRNIIATATNQIDIKSANYLQAKRFVSLWIAASRRQFEMLEKDGVKVAYQPFYVDEKTFCPSSVGKAEICARLGMDFNRIKDKFVISSFQRDTLGTDLISPKWQKGPDRLVNILSSLPSRDKWILLLAGPRRHYVVNECRKRGIPYFCYGGDPVPGTDDIISGNIPAKDMALLYNLTDCYLVASNSEGGPKAVLEAAWSKTPVLSTDVGLAPDILNEYSIYADDLCAIRRISDILKNQDLSLVRNSVAANHGTVSKVVSYPAMISRWREIYGQM